MIKKILFCVLLLTVVGNVNASSREESKGVRQYYINLVEKTTPEMTAIGKLYLQATKSPLVLQTNNEDSLALTTASMYIFGINTYAEYAQDAILVSVGEMDISLVTNKPVQIFNNVLSKFPKSISDMVVEMVQAVSTIKDPELKKISMELIVHAENLKAVFSDWPGPILRQHFGEKNEDDSKIPSNIVEAGVLVKSITAAVNDHFHDIEESEKDWGKYGLDYINLLRQTNRSVLTLSVLTPDIFYLDFEKFRLQTVVNKDENINADFKAVESVLKGRMKKYKDLLVFLESQCAVLHEKDAEKFKSLIVKYYDFSNRINDEVKN